MTGYEEKDMAIIANWTWNHTALCMQRASQQTTFVLKNYYKTA